jgi:iron complex outermembrane receptor protein
MMFGCYAGAAGQESGGIVTGRVTFATNGAPVHGATVMVIGARRSATTGDDGRFTIENVQSGAQEVLAHREHLSAARQTVTVPAGGTVTVDFALALEATHEEVTVTASATGGATAFDSFNAVTTLDSTEIMKSLGMSISDVLQHEPGISSRSFGPGSSRPIIRGFDGDRVLIMQDGMRTGDLSSQSGDHGVSIEASGLERLEIVKGPATLLYGSNAIGGVVNAITPQDAFRADPFDGMLGGATVDLGSANDQLGGSANIHWGRKGWSVWGGGSRRRTGDYDTALGPVANSAAELGTGRGGFGWVGTRTFFSASGQMERSRFGVPFAGEFHAHADESTGDEDADAGELAIDLKSRRRELRFDTGLRNLTNSFVDNLKLTVAAVDYRHDEIEVEGGVEQIGTEFHNETTSARVEIEQQRKGPLGGRLGLEWFGRDFVATGEEALAPPAAHRAVSVFAYEEMVFDRFRLQFGGRLERTAYTVGERPASSHEHDDTDEGDAPGEHAAPEVRDRAFTGVSGSFGVHRDLGERAAFVANVTTATRAPSLEELYNFGPHVGNAAFEIGNPNLEVERTFGLDVSLRRRGGRATGELNAFIYDIGNFVFFDFTDEQVDGLREAEVMQANSRFVGAEANGSMELGGHVHATAGVSFVRASLTDTGDALPRIPPVSARLELEVPFRGLTFTPEVVLAASQGRVFRDETRTAGYTLVNLSASYFVVRGHATHAITFKAHNLGNKAYRMHTSFLKDLAPEMGRGVKLSYTVRFF